MVGRVAAGIDPGFIDLSQPPSPATRRPLPILPPSLRPGGRSSSLRRPLLSDANPPYCVCLYSLFYSLSLSLFLPLPLTLSAFLFSLLSLCHPALAAAATTEASNSSNSSSSSQRHQLSSTPPSTLNCSRVSNRGASWVTLQVADRFVTMEFDCFGRHQTVIFEPEASSTRRNNLFRNNLC